MEVLQELSKERGSKMVDLYQRHLRMRLAVFSSFYPPINAYHRQEEKKKSCKNLFLKMASESVGRLHFMLKSCLLVGYSKAAWGHSKFIHVVINYLMIFCRHPSFQLHVLMRTPTQTPSLRLYIFL